MIQEMFYLEGKAPDTALLDNRSCSLLFLSWLLTSVNIEDELEWMQHACAHFHLNLQYAADIVVSGAVQCYFAMEEQAGSELRLFLVRAERALLSMLAFPENEDMKTGRMVPRLMQAGGAFKEGKGNDVIQGLYDKLVLSSLHEGWITDLAAKERAFFFMETEDLSEDVASLLNKPVELLLPEPFRTGANLQEIVVLSTNTLARHDIESCDVWEAVGQAFIDNL